MNRVTHFEIYTNDPEAAQPFYQDVFGWQFSKFEGGPIKICVPKMAIPKIGWLAYAEDPTGNGFGIIEPDTKAK